MLGRTYALGYEPDLPEAILHRPRRTVLNKEWPWAVWYPLRRSGRFAQLPPEEQRVILAEHGTIGMSYGAGDYAHDIRLACYGLDKNDNDFVIGLLGKELFPLSHIVQAMRKTQQTSLYLDRLGPFFVGRAVWQSPSVGIRDPDVPHYAIIRNRYVDWRNGKSIRVRRGRACGIVRRSHRRAGSARARPGVGPEGVPHLAAGGTASRP